jgi:Glycosyl transferase family 2
MERPSVTQPKVSIIIGNYNYAKYLPKAIDSALSQTYPDVEVIVVDDGSTDESRDVIRSYGGRVKMLFQENQGQTAAMNLGFEHSSGELVAFLDSDDLLISDAIRIVVDRWKPSFTKIQFPLEIIDADGEAKGLYMPRCRLDRGQVVQLLLKSGRYITSPTSGNVFSRSFLKEVMPVPVHEWPQSADGYLNTYAAFLGEIGVVDEALGCYRVHGKNVTSTVSKDSVNLEQLERIRSRGIRLKNLIEHIAHERKMPAQAGIVVSHWMYLKLEVALGKLSPLARSRDLCRAGWTMILSALRAPELTIIRRAELIAWTLGVVCLPKRAASPVVRFAFETAPTNWFPRLLRRW